MNIETLEDIYSFLRKPLPYSFALGFIGFVILVLIKTLDIFKVKTKKIKFTATILLLQVFLLGFTLAILQITILKKIRNDFTFIIENPQTEVIQVNNTFGNFTSDELKAELLKIKNYKDHHSGTSREMKLQVKTNNTIYNEIVAQDEYEKNEFWIFFDKYWFGSEETEIGRIKSTKFN